MQQMQELRPIEKRERDFCLSKRDSVIEFGSEKAARSGSNRDESCIQ
jgi:hypothetical protein